MSPRGHLGRWALALAALLGAAPSAAGAAPPALGALQATTQRQAIVLPPDLPGGLRLREASGLAWDAEQPGWWSVGDRGVLVNWSVSFAGTRLVAQAQAAWRMPGRVNAESVEVVPAGGPLKAPAPGGLAVLDEGRAQVQWLSKDGRVLAQTPLPALPQADYASGVEALAWHPRHGLLVVPQRPAPAPATATTTADTGSGSGPRLHLLVAEDGRHWTLAPGGPGKARIKAAHVGGAGRLLLLEKIDPRGAPPRWVLREVDLAACTPEGACTAAAVRVATEGLRSDDNFEGLACRSDEHCLLISDDGHLAEPRTVLLWLSLHRAPPP